VLFEYGFKDFPQEYKPTDVGIILQKIKHMLPEYIYDTARIENNPITIPEIKTLIDGITIGGRKITDVQQILNLKEAWQFLLENLKNSTFKVDKSFSDAIHSRVGKEEAVEWGVFRSGNIGIAGADKYVCPDYRELDGIYRNEISWVIGSSSHVENALRYFLWGSINQFYWDCNKRVSRMMAIGILVSGGFGIFNIPAKHIQAFNTLMVEFYNTKKADGIMEFLVKTSLKRIEREKEYYIGI